MCESHQSDQSAFDDWENISQSEVNLDGMEDPFKEKWRTLEKKHYDISDYKAYKSYRLKTMIVKANDDLR